MTLIAGVNPVFQANPKEGLAYLAKFSENMGLAKQSSQPKVLVVFSFCSHLKMQFKNHTIFSLSGLHKLLKGAG